MIRRTFLVLASLWGLGGALPPAVRAEESAPATAQALCDTFLAAMRRGPSIGFAGREQLLGPEIRRDFDLPLMARLIVGPPWRSLAAPDRDALVRAFSDYSIAVYAARFDSYSGERFTVDPEPTLLARGDCIVRTNLFTGGSEPVRLDYLMRQVEGHWRIIDIYLSGTISELAARRSEYSAVLRRGGAPALVALLRKKTAELGS